MGACDPYRTTMAHLSMTLLLTFSNSHHCNIKEMATRRHNFVLASCLNKMYKDYCIFIQPIYYRYSNYHEVSSRYF